MRLDSDVQPKKPDLIRAVKAKLVRLGRTLTPAGHLKIRWNCPTGELVGLAVKKNLSGQNDVVRILLERQGRAREWILHHSECLSMVSSIIEATEKGKDLTEFVEVAYVPKAPSAFLLLLVAVQSGQSAALQASSLAARAVRFCLDNPVPFSSKESAPRKGLIPDGPLARRLALIGRGRKSS